MSCRWMVVGLAAALLLPGACFDDSGSKSDSSVSADQSQTDQGQTDQGQTDQGQTDQGQTDQGQLVFDHPVTLRHDTGLPVVKLASFADLTVRVRFALDSGTLPFEVRSVDFVPAAAHTVIISVHADSGGAPGTQLVRKEVTIGSGDLDDWFSVDFSAEKAQVTQGPIWVVEKYKPTLPDAAEIIYGAPDTTGLTTVSRPGLNTIATNFEPLLRLQGATTQSQPPQRQSKFGDACGNALDCESGYCSGGTCSKGCTIEGDCGSGRSCREMAHGEKICVTTCSSDTACESTAQCLTDDQVLTAGFCVLRGPRANGTACNFQYHTICQSGHCSACDTQANCQVTGTCIAKK